MCPMRSALFLSTCLQAREGIVPPVEPHGKAFPLHREHILLHEKENGFPLVRIGDGDALLRCPERPLRTVERKTSLGMRFDLDLTVFHFDPILTIIKDFCAFVIRIVTNFSFFVEKLVVCEPPFPDERAHLILIVRRKLVAVLLQPCDCVR